MKEVYCVTMTQLSDKQTDIICVYGNKKDADNAAVHLTKVSSENGKYIFEVKMAIFHDKKRAE